MSTETTTKEKEELKSFKDVYDDISTETPKQKWIKEIAALTFKSENTVRQWLSGRQMPDALTQQIISEKLKVKAEILFPPKESETIEN